MKIAITGKGGVGKTTLAAAIIQLLSNQGQEVIALDADPNANLAAALGFPDDLQTKIVPISKQNKLIEERTGAKVKQYGQIFKLNPDVTDVVEKYATVYKKIPLLVLGGLEKGGIGCACPENTFIRALITDLILNKNQTLIIDMEAGIEHLGRGTAQGVDTMIIVVEPSARSVNVALKIIQMATEIGIRNIRLVGSKIMNSVDEDYVKKAIPKIPLLGLIPFSEEIRNIDKIKSSVLDSLSSAMIKPFEAIVTNLLELAK
jgi:CO dehydrogenase maturation factor